MYSAVMMIAMATNPETADCHRNYGCYGGYAYGGCRGNAYGGCYGGGAYRSGGGYYSYYGPGYSYPAYYAGPVYYNGTPGYTSYYGESAIPIIAASNMRAPATVEVSLPPDAKLLIDSTPVAAEGSMRRLVSPPIDPGQDYTYLLTGTIMRDGKEQKVEKRINVRAGQTTRVTLEFPGNLASR